MTMIFKDSGYNKADPSGDFKSRIPLHENIVDEHVQLCATRTLNIHFGLKCNGKPGSLHEKFWTQLIDNSNKWGNVHVSANNTCRWEERCLHSMVQGDMLVNAFRLRHFSAIKSEGECPNCGGPHNIVTLPVAAEMCSISIEIPVRITSWNSRNLRSLDIRTKADDTMWCSFFESCSCLEELKWRRHGPVRSTKTVVVPTLHTLQTYSVLFPPPITAPSLIVLNVMDGGDPFTFNHFKSLAGSKPLHLEHLNMLPNPTRNVDVGEIFRSCSNLVNVAVSTTETRTTFYGAVALRGRSQYIKFGLRKLESVQFDDGPPSNSRAIVARERYDALCRTAFKVVSNTVIFEPRAERLMVRQFPRDFTFGEEEQAALISENGMDPEATRLYDTDFNPFYPKAVSTSGFMGLVILTLDSKGANAIVARGWRYRGVQYKSHGSLTAVCNDQVRLASVYRTKREPLEWMLCHTSALDTIATKHRWSISTDANSTMYGKASTKLGGYLVCGGEEPLASPSATAAEGVKEIYVVWFLRNIGGPEAMPSRDESIGCEEAGNEPSKACCATRGCRNEGRASDRKQERLEDANVAKGLRETFKGLEWVHGGLADLSSAAKDMGYWGDRDIREQAGGGNSERRGDWDVKLGSLSARHGCEVFQKYKIREGLANTTGG
ncbi:hypothetical protein R3P38DRAFT_2805802 [Favolaschia claudopus]|uniref:Uncharacterized protein n=1 Tax=Favolaschia claudopus TaxID=2862362 RepID=A0AAV9ZLP1_9AGAR